MSLSNEAADTSRFALNCLSNLFKLQVPTIAKIRRRSPPRQRAAFPSKVPPRAAEKEEEEEVRSDFEEQ